MGQFAISPRAHCSDHSINQRRVRITSSCQHTYLNRVSFRHLVSEISYKISLLTHSKFCHYFRIRQQD
jgi:hypothetical protein